MIGDDAKPDVVLLVSSVTLATEFSGAIENRAGAVDLVQVVDALTDRRHALETHAGVDVLRRQLTKDREALLVATRAALELHEDQVPDLEVALLVRDRATASAKRGPAVVVDLAARAAWPRHAHRPEVVGHAPALDALVWHPNDVVPDRGRFVVIVEDGHP